MQAEFQPSESDLSEILAGLQGEKKHISSRFLYDEEGSRIFQEIMKMPEYYLYDCELEILNEKNGEIQKSLPFKGSYSVVEFGAGDGSKVVGLLRRLMKDPNFIKYYPVDISREATAELELNLKTILPDLKVESITGNYFENMQSLIPSGESVLLLFMGSNIGNFSSEKIPAIVKMFSDSLKSGDAVFIGFDLKKHPAVIRQAYDDPSGITKAFTLNLLRRFNREYKANFRMDNFDFYSCYHPESGEVRSYLVSLTEQEVVFGYSGRRIFLRKDELIHTEISKKFDREEISRILNQAGFTVLQTWTDQRAYYTDVLSIR